jgi:hypothetical protein
LLVRVCGVGIRAAQHITVETINHIKAARHVLYFPTAPGELEWLFKRLGQDSIESIASLYVDGDIDTVNYERIVTRVLEAAREKEDVAFVMSGHPRVGVTTLAWLESRMGTHGADVVVSEAVSSFDAMMNDLKRDPLEHGTLIVDANRMLLFNYILDPQLDVYVYHICSVGTTRTRYGDPGSQNRVHLLRDILLRFYQPDHPFVLLSSEQTAGLGRVRITGTIGKLEEIQDTASFASTLFIPGREADRSQVAERAKAMRR